VVEGLIVSRQMSKVKFTKILVLSMADQLSNLPRVITPRQ